MLVKVRVSCTPETKPGHHSQCFMGSEQTDGYLYPMFPVSPLPVTEDGEAPARGKRLGGG